MKLIAVLLLSVAPAGGQEILSERIKGLRVNGSTEAKLPVAGLASRPIIIEFDVNENEPPDLRIKVRHCDRDWVVTKTSFINDDIQNRSKSPLRYEPAPAGVGGYRFHYRTQLPGIAGIERFGQSGNYIFELWDEDYRNLLARGKFFVVEKVIGPSLKITNRSLPSEINPLNQVNKIEVAFTIPEPDSDRVATLFPNSLSVVEIYQDRRLYSPWRIDVDDRNPNTFVDGYGTSRLRFIADNILPGNSYRQHDLRSSGDYPPGRIHRSKIGADVSRYLQKPGRDGFGTSSLIETSRYADYMNFQFELVVEQAMRESVFVVGDFSGWKTTPAYAMTFNVESGRYALVTSIRRGIYDYQYVVGSNDWVRIEGNDWRSVNVYTAFVYYRDQRFGGFDRLVGYAQGMSGGGVASD